MPLCKGSYVLQLIWRSAHFYTRMVVALCQSLVDEKGWRAQREMLKWVKEEVSFWITRLEEFSGQPIRHSASILEYYVCSDSGKYLIGGRVSRKGAENKEKSFQVTLNEWETNASSAYRELRSIDRA